MEQWLRVLNLIITMNKMGVSVLTENPFDFEKRTGYRHSHKDSIITQGPNKLQVQVTENGS